MMGTYHLGDQRTGWLLTMTLLGDTALSLLLTISADRRGRRRMLVVPGEHARDM
jgi:MFS family permease